MLCGVQYFGPAHTTVSPFHVTSLPDFDQIHTAQWDNQEMASVEMWIVMYTIQSEKLYIKMCKKVEFQNSASSK